MTRRAVLPVLMLPSILLAQPSPPAAVRLAVGYGPGGGTDVVARAVGEELARMWGQPVLVENKPGANGAIATTHVARSAPDGANLLVMPPSTLIIDGLLRPNAAIDPSKSLTLISGLVTTPLVIVVPANSPYKTLEDLVKAAQAKDGKLSYGWGNLGMRMAMEELSLKAKMRLLPIGYKAAGQSVPAIIAGDISMLMIDIAPIGSLIKAGRVRALAVSTPVRTPLLPDVPTMKEAGVDVDVTGSIALFGPAHLPSQMLQKIRADVTTVLRNPDIQNRFSSTGMTAYTGNEREFEATLTTRTKTFQSILINPEFRLE